MPAGSDAAAPIANDASPRPPETDSGTTSVPVDGASSPDAPPVAPSDIAVIAAAGDIACGAGSTGAACRQMQTSDVVLGIDPDAVLILGDNQYEEGGYGDFMGYFDPSWGRFKDRIWPAVGNHEYLTTDAAGYFDYFNGAGNFNGRAGDRDKGYYAFDVGSWRLYALNTVCSHAGGCGAGSPQETWLRRDLEAHPRACQLMYAHHPLWTSDTREFDTTAVQPLYQAFYDAGGEVVLVGHSHFYERFAPQDPAEHLDEPRGLRQFIVGTGGRNTYGFGAVEPNSEVRATVFGVLQMTLYPDHYDWEFVSIAGSAFRDSGSSPCH